MDTEWQYSNLIDSTVNVIIFAGGKFRENVGKTFHVGVIFTIVLDSFRKAYGFYFRVGVIFAKKTKSWKTRKLPLRKNFHVYSTLNKVIWKISAQ